MEKTKKWWVFNLGLTAYNGPDEEYDVGNVVYFFGTSEEARQKASEELCLAFYNVPAAMYCSKRLRRKYADKIRENFAAALKRGYIMGDDYQNRLPYQPELGPNDEYVALPNYYSMRLYFECLDTRGTRNKKAAANLTKAIYEFVKGMC